METKVKYQYTYFIYSYRLKNIEYKEYINKLLNNKKYNIKKTDKGIFEIFNNNIKKTYFNGLTDDLKISENYCNVFEYTYDKDVQGKFEEDNNIFFEIPKIEIMCFKTGICFLILKTNLANKNTTFKDVLNFNYKMKDIYSEYAKLKNYENINIQTDVISNINSFKIFMKNIVMQEIEENRFYLYSYTCVDSENWNNEINKLENDFLKYLYVYPYNYEITFNDEKNIQIINDLKYVKIGFTNNSMNLLCNDLEVINYTKILNMYENEYLYILLINLYKKELLKNIEENNIIIKNEKEYEKIYKEILKFELTEDIMGNKINNKLLIVFKINEKINIIKNKLKKILEIKLIKKYKKFGQYILFILIISLLLNIFLFLNN